jgi:hypothetical protein
LARDYLEIEGKAEAAMRSDYLGQEQREALAQSLVEGDAWSMEHR